MAIEIRDMTLADLPKVGWSGGSTHLRAVAATVQACLDGDGHYLVAVDGNDAVGLGAVAYRSPGLPRLWQLVVHPEQRSRGVGSLIIAGLEQKALEQDHREVELLVELDNDRARRLYEHLGYVVTGEDTDSWEVERPGGGVASYVARCFVMSKQIG